MYANDAWVWGVPTATSSSHISTVDRVKVHDFVQVWVNILNQLLVCWAWHNGSLHRAKWRANLRYCWVVLTAHVIDLRISIVPIDVLFLEHLNLLSRQLIWQGCISRIVSILRVVGKWECSVRIIVVWLEQTAATWNHLIHLHLCINVLCLLSNWFHCRVYLVLHLNLIICIHHCHIDVTFRKHILLNYTIVLVLVKRSRCHLHVGRLELTAWYLILSEQLDRLLLP